MTTLDKGQVDQLKGQVKICDQLSILEEYAASLSGQKVFPKAVIFPKTVSEVQAILKLANAQNLPVFPISKGKNWGYGSAQGTQKGQIIIDLSKMNNIVEVNEDLAIARIQPGVTQQELSEYLTTTGSKLQADVTGAGTNTSILGNTLERGLGHSSHGNRIKHVICLKVVLADGSIIETGFANYINAKAKHTYAPGLGPNFLGLFVQSNFGVVVEMTIELQPKPDYFCMFFAISNHKEDYLPLAMTTKALKLKQIVHSVVHIANLKRAVGNSTKKVKGEWGLSGDISGPKQIVKAKQKFIKKYFKKHAPNAKVIFVTDFKVKCLQWIDKHIKPNEMYRNIDYIIDFKKGIPSNRPLEILLDNKGLHSEVPTKSFPSNFRWICATCPAKAEALKTMYTITESMFKKHGVEFRVTLNAVTARTYIMICSIKYDKEEAAVKKANALYYECRTALLDAGFYPYRSGSGMFEETNGLQDPKVRALLTGIKNQLDPLHIIAPGKYNI